MLKGREGAIKRFARKTEFARDILKLAFLASPTLPSLRGDQDTTLRGLSQSGSSSVRAAAWPRSLDGP